MANFTYVTFADAIADLQERLYITSDATRKQWTDAELTAYLVEALRTWNALTGYWRADMSFSTVPSQQWYDLTTVGGTVRPFTVTDNVIMQMMEYHLLEPLTSSYPLAWTGSGQYNVHTVLGALERAQDIVLGTTACTLARSTQAITGVRSTLADTILEVRRLAWLPPAGSGYSATPLTQGDREAMADFDAFYTTAAQEPPMTWAQSSQPPLELDLDRLPPTPSDLELITVTSGGLLSTTSASVLRVPDDWTWVVKWVALGMLFEREGLAHDALRAEYCGKRRDEAMGYLLNAPVILNARLNGVPLDVDSVRAGDDYDSGWQSAAPGTPSYLYTAGLNLVAMRSPDAGPYSITLQVVKNAPVSSAPGDFVQFPRDSYDALLDYAQHLAMLKSGGEEFLLSIPLYSNFLRAASLYNSKLSGMGFFQKEMAELSQLYQERVPSYGGVKPGDTK